MELIPEEKLIDQIESNCDFDFSESSAQLKQIPMESHVDSQILKYSSNKIKHQFNKMYDKGKVKSADQEEF